MTSTDIERHHGNTVAIHDDHYMDRLPQLAQQLSRSNMCPEAFRGKPDDIAIIGYSLADNGIRLSINTLPQCYVVKGRPGYMAQIQTAMAALHGIDIHPVGDKCNERSATVEVVMPNGVRHEVTFTMAEAVRAGLDKSPGDMYRKFPTNMLVARATTRAISWYCPAVKLGLAGTVDMDEIGVIDAEAHDSPATSPQETGEMIPVPTAKKLVLDAYKAAHAGEQVSDEHAARTVKLLWWAHNLPNGQQTMLRSRLDGILSRFAEGDTPDRAEQPPAEVRPEPEHVTPELVDPLDERFDGANADSLPFDEYEGPDGEPF